MAQGILTQDISYMGNGLKREKGNPIAEHEVPPSVWAAWVEEGIIQLPKKTESVSPVVLARNKGKGHTL